MTFHTSADFQDAIRATAAHFNMRDIFIEKDYWVTHVLKNLSTSSFKDKIIFKGGTSLSKAFNCIDRFSEDIDLAILKDGQTNDNQLKKQMKSAEQELTHLLEYFKHPNEEKRGRNRKTFYRYPKVLQESDFGQIREHIQLEINTFTNPIPFEEGIISTYISQFLEVNGFTDLITAYQLEPFQVKVLKRERTFFEKLMSLIRLSYSGPSHLEDKIRHFYDMHMLLNQADLSSQILTEGSYPLIDLVMADDKQNNIFSGDWLHLPLSESPLFADVNTSWKALNDTYTRELSQLSWSDSIPPAHEIIEMLNSIKAYLVTYDSSKE